MDELMFVYKDRFNLCQSDITLSETEDCAGIVRKRFDDLREGGEFHQEVMTLAFKNTLLDLVMQGNSDEHRLAGLYNVLDISLEISRQGHFELNVVLTGIEDLMDVLAVEDSIKLFDYMETRSKDLTKGMEPQKGTALTLLRICNELLRRLLKAKNTQSSGRILLFLSSAFSLSDRSGVNQKGEFNVENKTEFERDFTLDDIYTTFWSLQEYFSNPLLLFDAAKFKDMRTKVEAVFERFENVQKDNEKSTSSPKRRNNRRDNNVPSKNNHFFPKYLTSSTLFKLELNDSFFRRQWIYQFLILNQFLLTSLDDNQPGNILNKSVIHILKITREEEDWLMVAKKRAHDIMERIQPHNKSFSKLVQTTMAHERNWIHWKGDLCKSYEKPPFFEEKSSLKKRRLDGSQAADPKFLGNDALTHLWESGGNIQGVLLKKKERCKTYTKDLGIVLQELDGQVGADLVTPMDGIEEEYILYNQMRYNWLSYRSAIQSNLSLFSRNEFDSHAPSKSLLKSWREN